MPIQNGRNTELLFQFENTFRQAPTADAASLKFNEGLSFEPSIAYLDDPTVSADALAGKRDESDEAWSIKVPAIMCLNDIGYWLKLMLGNPSSTGSGTYTHTYTLDLAERPSALMEFGFLTANKRRRWLGCKGQTLSWGVKDGDGNISMDLIGAVQELPHPGSAFDGSPTRLAKDRACQAYGEISDGGDTLGRVISTTIEIGCDHEGLSVADGNRGYGAIPLGLPYIKGSMRALLFDGSAMDYAEDHTSRSLTLINRNSAGDHSLTGNLPAVEFDKPSYTHNTSKGLIVELDWRAHSDASAPTFVLVNGVADY